MESTSWISGLGLIGVIYMIAQVVQFLCLLICAHYTNLTAVRARQILRVLHRIDDRLDTDLTSD